MKQTQLDWSTAEVHDGTLTVALDDKPPKEWTARFKTTVQLLNHGSWEKVGVKKGEISVKAITAGDEDRVRHFLESAVLQANGALESNEPDTDPDENDDDAASREDGPDLEMTERFRAFASSDGEASHDREK